MTLAMPWQEDQRHIANRATHQRIGWRAPRRLHRDRFSIAQPVYLIQPRPADNANRPTAHIAASPALSSMWLKQSPQVKSSLRDQIAGTAPSRETSLMDEHD
jgi:hypothetical protein